MNGKRRANRDAGHKKIRGSANRQPVIGIADKATNQMRIAVLADASGRRHLVPEHIAGGAGVHTDEASGCAGFAGPNRVRETISHSGDEHVGRDGNTVIATNRVESGCPTLRAFPTGADSHADPKHLPACPREAAYRCYAREPEMITQAGLRVSGGIGKRLRRGDLVAGTPEEPAAPAEAGAPVRENAKTAALPATKKAERPGFDGCLPC